MKVFDTENQEKYGLGVFCCKLFTQLYGFLIALVIFLSVLYFQKQTYYYTELRNSSVSQSLSYAWRQLPVSIKSGSCLYTTTPL